MNGNWFISGGKDNLIKLWDIRTMKELATYKGHHGATPCFHRTHSILVPASLPKIVHPPTTGLLFPSQGLQGLSCLRFPPQHFFPPSHRPPTRGDCFGLAPSHRAAMGQRLLRWGHSLLGGRGRGPSGGVRGTRSRHLGFGLASSGPPAGVGKPGQLHKILVPQQAGRRNEG